jgi:hypothetical protein
LPEHLKGAAAGRLKMRAGLTFTMPLTMFLFVVALGTDYNILMTRPAARGDARGQAGP